MFRKRELCAIQVFNARIGRRPMANEAGATTAWLVAF
jgi:hypothetical protein